MKSDSIGLKFKNSTEEHVSSILYNIVVEIRNELAKQYNVYRGECENYTGLCDMSVDLLILKLRKYAEEHDMSIDCHGIHGEQKHSPRLNSCLWPVQHTWAVVKMMGVTMYVDPTSSQFKRMYYYIPDFYISTRKPKWYYPDSKNIAFMPVFRFINKHIKVPVTKFDYTGTYKLHTYKEGIIEWFQYEIWGKICDSRRKQERRHVRQL